MAEGNFDQTGIWVYSVCAAVNGGPGRSMRGKRNFVRGGLKTPNMNGISSAGGSSDPCKFATFTQTHSNYSELG